MFRYVIYFSFFLVLHYTESSLSDTPKRVISLSPLITEVLFSLGVNETIVGTSDYSNHPQAAKDIPRIGSYVRPNVEKIVHLKPDLAIGNNEGVDRVSRSLEQAGIPLLVVNSRRLSDYPVMLRTLGERFQAQQASQKVIRKWETEWQRVPRLKKQPNVLIQIDHQPLIVAGRETFLDEVLQRCGAKNVANFIKGYPRLNVESLMDKKVDAVVVIGVPGADLETIKKYWAKLPVSKASKVFSIEPDSISRLGPRLPSATGKLCRQLARLTDETK